MSFFSEVRWLWGGFRATSKTASLLGRGSALYKHGRHQEALAVTEHMFEILAGVSPKYRLHPGYASAFIIAATLLDDVNAALGRSPPCAELREALALLTDTGVRFNPRLVRQCEDVKRRVEARCAGTRAQ
jgi:hypothetical protein